RGAAVRAGRAPVEKRLHLVLQQAFLDRVEELFGFPERQAQVLDALGVLLQGDDVGDSFFLAIIAAHDELEFDTHGWGSSGFEGWVNDAGPYTGVRHLSPASPCSRGRTLAAARGCRLLRRFFFLLRRRKVILAGPRPGQPSLRS